VRPFKKLCVCVCVPVPVSVYVYVSVSVSVFVYVCEGVCGCVLGSDKWAPEALTLELVRH